MSVKCLQVRSISNPQEMSQIIYQHFSYLSQYPKLNHNPASIEKLLKAPNNISYLLYFKDKIIAYMIGDMRDLSDNRHVYYISYIYVLKEYRGKKIGSLLIRRAVKLCREVGIPFIILTCDKVNTKALNFYRKHGFVLDPVLGNCNQTQSVMCLYL